MIDIIITALVTSGLWLFVLNSRPRTPGSPGLPATLLQGFEKIMSQFSDNLVAEIDQKIAAAVAAAEAAAAQALADAQAAAASAQADLDAIKAHVDGLPG